MNSTLNSFAIVQFSENSLTPVNSWTAPSGDAAYSMGLSGNYLYAVLVDANGNFEGVAQIDASTMEQKATLTGFSFATNGFDAFIGANSNGNLLGQYYNSTVNTDESIIGVFSAEDFSLLQNVVVPYIINGGPYYCQGNLYVCVQDGEVNNLLTYNAQTLELTSSVQLSETQAETPLTNSIVVLNGAIYQGFMDNNGFGNVFKFDMSGNLIGDFNESTIGFSGDAMGLCSDGTNLYVGSMFTNNPSLPDAFVLQLDTDTMTASTIYDATGTSSYWSTYQIAVNGDLFLVVYSSLGNSLYASTSAPSPTPTSTSSGGGSISMPTPTSSVFVSPSVSRVLAPLGIAAVPVWFWIVVVVIIAVSAVAALMAVSPKKKPRSRHHH
jgi:hypothetical protein